MAVLDKLKNVVRPSSKPAEPGVQISKAINKKAVIAGAMLIIGVLVMVVMFSI